MYYIVLIFIYIFVIETTLFKKVLYKMKITVSINIGGMAFHIDEDAYSELKIYLRSLERYFAKEPSSAEIMSDIEARIADLLKARISDSKQVITIDDIREVTGILGTPEDISDDSGAGQYHYRIVNTGYHRMYRDPDKRIIAGVCSGMAAYWRIDPWIVRVIFIIISLPGGLGILIYLILWIVLPEAKTTAQKIEMKGEPVNIHNIKDSVKQEFNNVKDKMNL